MSLADFNLRDPNKKKIQEPINIKYVFGITTKSSVKNIEPIKIESQVNENRFT